MLLVLSSLGPCPPLPLLTLDLLLSLLCKLPMRDLNPFRLPPALSTLSWLCVFDIAFLVLPDLLLVPVDLFGVWSLLRAGELLLLLAGELSLLFPLMLMTDWRFRLRDGLWIPPAEDWSTVCCVPSEDFFSLILSSLAIFFWSLLFHQTTTSNVFKR